MKQKSLLFGLTTLFLLAGLSWPQAQASGSAPASGGYELSWSTVDGGGFTSSAGGSYAVDGTIGQPDASAETRGSTYTFIGGFWGGLGRQFRVYLPTVLKDY